MEILQAEPRESVLVSRPAKMFPILISGPGRSGTTLLMRMLSGSPNVAVAKTPPYEVRLLAYYAKVDRLLNSDATEATNPDHPTRALELGANPYFREPFVGVFKGRQADLDDIRLQAPAFMADAWRSCVESYYSAVAPSRPFFAEKNDNASPLVVGFAERLFGKVRQILTMRDPRDLFCSHRAYFKSPPEIAARDVTFACRLALSIVRHQPAGSVFVRYEDLVRDQYATRERLGTFLRVEMPPIDQSEGFSRHGTSASPDASIGRWKTDMTADEKTAYLPQWADAIDALGYEH